MGVKSFFIKLEPHQEIYFSGQNITGSIYADVSTSTSCRAVELHFLGRADVRWTERSFDNASSPLHRVNKSMESSYTAREEYFNFKINKWAPQEPGEKLPAGNHFWPFDFQLPKEIPSSFQGQYGTVRYSIKAKVDIPFGIDAKHEISFCVNCPFDLNFSNKAKAPLKIASSNTPCYCYCISNDPVSMNISSRRSGAVVGEAFTINGEICSKSPEKVAVALHQTVEYHAMGRSKKVSSEVSKIEMKSTGEEDTWYLRDVSLLVPPVVPGLHFCNIMDVSYQLKVKASFGWCTSVSGQCEFFVGTVPFFVDGGVSGHSGDGVHADNFSARDSGYSASSVEYPTPSSYLDQPQLANSSSSEKSDLIPNSNPATKNPYSSGMYSNFSTSDEPSPYSIVISSGVKKNSGAGDAVTLPPSSNLYPNRRPPVAKPCWFSSKSRFTIGEKDPPPMYLSYEGCF